MRRSTIQRTFLLAAFACVGCKKQSPAAKQQAQEAPASAKDKAADPKAKAPEPSDDEKLPALPKGDMGKVGDVAIPMSQFQEIYQLKQAKYKARGRSMPSTAERRYRRSISDRLVYLQALEREAAKAKITPDPKVLADRLERSKHGLKDWSKHLQRRGETEASLKGIYKAEELEKLILEHRKKLEVSEKEVKDEYDRIKDNYKSEDPRVRASHILVSTRPGPDATGVDDPEAKKARVKAAKTRADELYKKAKAKGTDFAALAKESSDGPSRYKGGDLGVFSAKRMVKEFSQAAFKLKPGQISKPVLTKFGYHIIKVTERFKPGLLPMSALEDQIRVRLRARKMLDSKRELKKELMGAKDVVNHVSVALGPPVKGDKVPPLLDAHGHGHGHGGGHGHGHGAGHGHDH